MIDMPTVNSIRQQRRDGYSVSEIARMNGVSRDTVYKYLRKDDFSPRPPARRHAASKLDPYKPTIDQWLDDDARNWRKQRHTARRIWQRLTGELGADVSESTVERYVRQKRTEMRGARSQFLDLVWEPGQAQADFGEADFYVAGVRRRLSYFVLTFPYSNVGLAQVFPSENAECVCQALENIFGYIGGAPTRIVFDNATGIGRRVCGGVRTTELFGGFAAHYGFSYSFCNPYAGHEKGSVENKVGFIRRSLFVPVPRMTGADAFNERLLDKCMALSDKGHWAKGEDERRLFADDRLALLGLPETPFRVVRYVVAKANKKGKVQVDGPHLYSTDPALAGRELTVALGATTLEVFDDGGALVCRHERAYGSAPTDTADPASQLHLLCLKPGGWGNSRVRASLAEDVRAHMDSLGRDDLRAELRLMRDEAARSGWAATSQAVELAYATTRRIDSASVAVSAARIASGGGAIAYDDPVDLGVYDSVFGAGEA
jgi:transposase